MRGERREARRERGEGAREKADEVGAAIKGNKKPSLHLTSSLLSHPLSHQQRK